MDVWRQDKCMVTRSRRRLLHQRQRRGKKIKKNPTRAISKPAFIVIFWKSNLPLWDHCESWFSKHISTEPFLFINKTNNYFRSIVKIIFPSNQLILKSFCIDVLFIYISEGHVDIGSEPAGTPAAAAPGECPEIRPAAKGESVVPDVAVDCCCVYWKPFWCCCWWWW